MAKSAFYLSNLPEDRAQLRKQIEILVNQYLLRGGVIHVCRPAVAVGASFKRNLHPRFGAQAPRWGTQSSSN